MHKVFSGVWKTDQSNSKAHHLSVDGNDNANKNNNKNNIFESFLCAKHSSMFQIYMTYFGHYLHTQVLVFFCLYFIFKVISWFFFKLVYSMTFKSLSKYFCEKLEEYTEGKQNKGKTQTDEFKS